MSGVFGYCDQGHPERVEPTLVRMAGRLSHDTFHRTSLGTPAPGVGLGRHAGGVLNPATQPVWNGADPVWLTLSGEFYQTDRRPARTSEGTLADSDEDASLALRVYLGEGREGLTRLNGAFTMAVWDGRIRELTLVNDRFGLYPHYFAHIDRRFVFAPEIKAVLAAPEMPRTLNRTAVAEYIRFQQLLGDKTWLEDVRLLPPASVLKYRPDENRLAIERYWDWDRLETRWSLRAGEAVEEWRRLFGRAVRARTNVGERVGLYLSGGLDSRLVLAFLRLADVPVSTFTYGAPDSRDVVFATRVAQRAGTTHRLFPYADGRWILDAAARHLALTEGMHAWHHAHGLDTLDAVRSEVDVCFSGWRCGYRHVAAWWFGQPRGRTAPTLGEIDLTRHLFDAFCEKCTWPGLTESEAAALCSGEGDSSLRWLAFDSLRAEVARTGHYPPERRADCFYTQQHDRRSTVNLVVFTRSSVDVRLPWFDYDFVDFLYSLPTHIDPIMVLRGHVLTQSAPSLARVPYDKDARLPSTNPIVRTSHAAWQRARLFVNRRIAPVLREHPTLYADYEQWLRTDLRGWAEAILFDDRTMARGLFDPNAVRTLWERHLAGKELWTIGKVAPLITIELVLRLLDESG